MPHILFLAAMLQFVCVDCFLFKMSAKPNFFLEGPFKPVSEERSVVCKVSGIIPDSIKDSIFTRIGPNPMFSPCGGYHLFDGDGVVHWVTFDNDTHATYHNRYIQTRKLRAEKYAGRALYPTIGDFLRPFALVKIALNEALKVVGVLPNIPRSHLSVANTNIIQHASKQLALCESGLPYSIEFTENGLRTLGVETYGGFLKNCFTAHPKIDLKTGKMHGFGSDGCRDVRMYSFNSDGTPDNSFIIQLRESVLMHDFATTAEHLLLLDMPLEFNPMLLTQGKIPVLFEHSHSSRVGVLNKDDDTGSSLRWYEVPGDSFLVSHVINSYADSGLITLVSCDMPSLSLHDVCGSHSALHKTVINTLTGDVTRKPVLGNTHRSFDFPVINGAMAGTNLKYTYVTEFTSGVPGDIFKIDLHDATITGSVQMKDGEYSGECAFVASSGDCADEDDGHLLSFVTSDAVESKLCIWDARNLELVGKVTIPCRIPLGFHANMIAR